MLVSIFLEHVVSLGPSFSSDEHHCSHNCLGTGIRIGETKTRSSLSCIFGPLAFAIVHCRCWCVVQGSTSVLSSLIKFVSILAKEASFLVGVRWVNLESVTRP